MNFHILKLNHPKKELKKTESIHCFGKASKLTRGYYGRYLEYVNRPLRETKS